VSCGIPLCDDCAEESRPGEYYCFGCAMLHSVSEAGDSLIRKREEANEKRRKKKKWGPFQFFVLVSSVLILVMWGVILFGGRRPPGGGGDFVKNERTFLFTVDSAIKRYAHYEGNRYPEDLSQLIPKYLPLGEDQSHHLTRLSYKRVPKQGYLLSLANPKPGEVAITISPKGIKYELSPGEGA
jgi:hypothetical protein